MSKCLIHWLVRAVAISLLNIGAVQAFCAETSSQFDFAKGPYKGKSVFVGKSDVRDYGCGECAPTLRILGTPDLDGDGNSEIILAMESFSKKDDTPLNVPLPILFFKSDGKPYAGIKVPPRRIHPRESIVADFNGDKIDDVFIVAHGMDAQPFPGEQNVLLLSQPNGSHADVSATFLPQMNDMSHGAGAGDIDGDGDIDLVVITNPGVAKVDNYILLNNGRGKMVFSAGFKHLPPGTPRKTGFFLTARLADLNDDGFNDLIMAGEGWNGFPSIVLKGDGKGHFSSVKKLPRSPWDKKTFTSDIRDVDLNGDGRLDLVLLNTGEIDGQIFRGLHIQTLVQKPNGDFADETTSRLWKQDIANSSTVSIAHNIFFADLDGDGDLDFVVQSLNPVWREVPGDVPPQIGINDGKGFFRPVDPNWLSAGQYSFREMTPFTIAGKKRIAGYSLNGINETDGFWVVGHQLYLFK